MAELSIELPPMVYGGGCSIGSTVFALGGSLSVNIDDFSKYHKMSAIYSTTSPGEYLLNNTIVFSIVISELLNTYMG
jgi:hypothetical protein